MPIIVYVCTHLGRAYFEARGVRQDSIPYMIKIELTNIPVKSEIVYTDVDCLLIVQELPQYGPGP